MGLTPVKMPFVVKRMFPNYVWDIPSTGKTLYLTFDDGPTPEITEWTLKTLGKYHAKATFFCIGANIEKHPDIFQHILKAGHSIGNHTQNHLKGWNVKTKDYLDNIELCETILKTQIQNSRHKVQSSRFLNKNQSSINTDDSRNIANLFRPPYGKIKPMQSKALLDLGYKIVMWDILSFDWDKSVTKEACLNNVISRATNGSIIVFHDSVKAAKNMQHTLPKVLEYFSEKGYLFKSIDY